MFMKIFLVQ